MSRGKALVEIADIMEQWDPDKNELNPELLTAGSKKKAWWLCGKGHSWSASISNRVSRNSGCPYCASKKVLPGFNDLRTTEPRLADEWDTDRNGALTPEMVTRYSGKVVWWRCEKGQHSWDMSIAKRTLGYECPFCSGNRVLAGFNDLLTLNPRLASEWDYEKNQLLPSQVTVSSGKHVFWKCAEWHSWKAKIAARNLAGTDCPYCNGKRVQAGFNDLQTHNPKLASEWDADKNELLPSQVTPFSTKKVWWRCENGHSWRAAVAGRSAGNKCPYCSGRKVLAGYNDLKTANPKLADEWDDELNDIAPSQVTAKSNRKVWWRCILGHSWSASIYERSNGTSCPFCSGRRVLAGFNDLETINPELADEWDTDKNSLLPSQVTVFSEKSVWWKCKDKGHSWKTGIATRSSGTNCPYCAGRISYTPKCVH
jgi:DNA-directed RNA polymerase subunit RPC12/RpoP